MCDVCPPLERHERQQETDGQRGVSSVLLKACKGCGRLIPQALTMCEQCEARQQSRHVTYNNTRRDPRAAEFYLSKEWRELRPVIMSVYEYVDIYALYVEHQLITLKDSDPIHHIIELEEDWEQRLNPLNLIPLSHRTHNTTDIIELRRSEDNLEQYVNVEGVTTKSGSRNIEVDADSTPFDNVDEEADFPDMDEPKFKKIVYAIKKKGGILKITAELFEDTAANVMAYINKWIAKKTKATRNAMILKVANEMTKGKEVVISTIDSLKDVFNVGLDPAITTGAMVIANQNGYNYLDKLKDKDGKYILQPNPTQPTQMMLFGKYPMVKVSNRTVKSEPVYSPAFTISGSKLAIDGTTTAIDASATSDVTAWKVVKGKYVVTCKGQEQETTVDAKVSAYKHPVYMGDLKEAITLFDRNVITIDMNDKAAGLWEKDMTGIKVRDRFDVQPVDDGAIIKGNITEVVQG